MVRRRAEKALLTKGKGCVVRALQGACRAARSVGMEFHQGSATRAPCDANCAQMLYWGAHEGQALLTSTAHATAVCAATACPRVGLGTFSMDF